MLSCLPACRREVKLGSVACGKISTRICGLPFIPHDSTTVRRYALVLYTYDSSGSVNLQERATSMKGNVKIYPNPSLGEFKLEVWSESDAQMTFRVNNILGQSVLNGGYNVQVVDNKFVLDAQSIEKGMYIFTIFKGNMPVYSSKIIKQ